MKYVKLFEQFTSSDSGPFKDVTRMGESVFLFHEEDSIWYGIFPNDIMFKYFFIKKYFFLNNIKR